MFSLSQDFKDTNFFSQIYKKKKKVLSCYFSIICKSASGVSGLQKSEITVTCTSEHNHHASRLQQKSCVSCGECKRQKDQAIEEWWMF